MKKFCFFICTTLLLLSGAGNSFAQSDDFGAWMSVSVEKEIKKWDFGFEQELRTMDNSSHVERVSSSLSAEYKLFKPLKIGASYEFIVLNDLENDDLQPRHRGNVYLQGKYKIGRLTASLRERIQVTYKDETERTYKMNPKWSWRNKLKFDYNIPHSPVSPFASFETFYQLNNPDGNKFDNLRYSAGTEYKFNKHHAIEIYGLIDKEINVKKPVRRFVAGAGYSFSF